MNIAVTFAAHLVQEETDKMGSRKCPQAGGVCKQKQGSWKICDI